MRAIGVVSFLSPAYLMIDLKGVMPIPPAKKIAGVVSSKVKVPAGCEELIISPGFIFSINFLKGLIPFFGVIIKKGSVGEEETVKARVLPSGSSIGSSISKYCPG